MSQFIITEYSGVGSLNQSPVTQSIPTPVPGKILAHQELDGAGAGEASVVFHPDTRIIKILAVDEPGYFGFVTDPANVVSGARDYLNEKESVYHGTWDKGVRLYDRISVVDATDVT